MIEEFNGNLYLFFSYNLSKNNEINKKDVIGNEFTNEYLNLLNNQFNLEITNSVGKEIKREHLGSFEFYHLDGNENLDDNMTEEGNVFISSDKLTGLTIITVVFYETQIEISQMLDRVSQNNIVILDKGIKKDLNEYLNENYNLDYLGTCKVCISTNNTINENLYPSYFANETYDSDVMSALLREDKYGKNSKNNIAQYTSSDIYSGKNTVIRIDKRKNYSNRLKSDIIFLFIIEVLMFKECAIDRATVKMIKQLSSKNSIDTTELNNLYDDFSKTISFWDIRVFKYISAQNLANELEQNFKIEDKYKQYKEYQVFLNHKINVKQSIQQEKESMILFVIAIILFIFEIYNFFKDFFPKINSLTISFFILLFIIYFKKKKKKND